jgi:NADPH:quinone reductase-like Zn-dependent oxidoreductase
MHLSGPKEKDIELIRDLLESGTIKPVIEKTCSLVQMIQAHRHVESGPTKGKGVVQMQKG